MAKIAVDVTPLLPGGVNGGAKPMVVALLQKLPQLMEDHEFILWTADYSHEELAFLDRPNVKRICIHHQEAPDRTGLRSVGSQLRNHVKKWLPEKVKHWLRLVYFRLKPIQPKLPKFAQEKIDFLFCPFSAPSFYDPTIPVLAVIYDLQFLDYPEFFKEDERFYRKLHFDRISRQADHVVTISDFTRQSVLKNSDLLPEQVTTIHIGLVHDFSENFSPAEMEELLERLKLNRGRYLFYPANFWLHKNHEALLRGFHEFRQKHPDSDLKLVCTGALEERRTQLLKTLASLGLAEHVVMPGFLPDREIGMLFRLSRGLIFPSLYEGFGIPLLEAMQSGIPVACSNVTSLPEVGGDAVLYFDPKDSMQIADAIQSLEYNEDLRANLIKKGEFRFERFGTAERMAKEYRDLIISNLGGSKKIHRYGLHGITEDGWFSDVAYLTVTAADQSRRVFFELLVPGWMPNGVEVQISHPDAEIAQFQCDQGGSLEASFILPVTSGVVEFRFSRAHIPLQLGISGDPRSLSAFCTGFQIRSMDGNILFDVYGERQSS